MHQGHGNLMGRGPVCRRGICIMIGRRLDPRRHGSILAIHLYFNKTTPIGGEMTKPNSNLKITAKHLGPILQFEAELSKHAQNLLFARNGTGKSFLTRAIRCLERNKGEEYLANAPGEIVSQESTDGLGSLELYFGETLAGHTKLNRNNSFTESNPAEFIYHVFSEEFVRDELRARGFDPDSEITGQIAVDRENIELDDAEISLRKTTQKKSEAKKVLETLFDREKDEKLARGAGVNKALRDYKHVTFDLLREKALPEPPARSCAQLLTDLDAVRGIPDHPTYPAEVHWMNVDGFDANELKKSLTRRTSLSSVAAEIKAKIEKQPDFYRIGTSIYEPENETCPLCEQELRTAEAKALIASLVEYFSDEEESHKQELRNLQGKIERQQKALASLKVSAEKQVAEFDSLKTHLPSKNKETIHAPLDRIARMQSELGEALQRVRAKFNELSVSLDWDSSNYDSEEQILLTALDLNNTTVSSLNESIRLSDAERISLHRKICKVFGDEFLIDHWRDFESLRTLAIDEKEKAAHLARLQRLMPATDAKTRVAETFELLLGAVFTGKYKFDREKFVLTLSDKALPRQTDKTLSEGEKTAIAFCYFIASVHKCVEADFEYEKLFLVLDDPVASMSYDYIFSISQILKNLNISKVGEVSLNPSLANGNTVFRPNLLILTHSSYFFNILYNNRVIKDDAAFSISIDSDVHSAKKLKTFVAPFQEQLRHIKSVAEGSQPDFGTANCVRSVLEAVGRFCRPDKADTLSNFITHLAGEEGLEIRSVIINALSHGSFLEEIAPPEDLTLACTEAIRVVQRYAPGQLEAL